MPNKREGAYFVSFDTPPAPSRTTPLAREQHWADNSTHGPEPAHRRRRRKFKIRPLWIVALALAGWLGWAYTTPGGPSERIRQWIDHTRGDIAQASANPDLRRSAKYFNGLYATQRSYPNPSDSAIEAAPDSGFGLGMSFDWCGPRAVVLHALSSGGSVSRLLLDGKDLGNVAANRPCPSSLSNPAPWKIPKR